MQNLYIYLAFVEGIDNLSQHEQRCVDSTGFLQPTTKSQTILRRQDHSLTLACSTLTPNYLSSTCLQMKMLFLLIITLISLSRADHPHTSLANAPPREYLTLLAWCPRCPFFGYPRYRQGQWCRLYSRAYEMARMSYLSWVLWAEELHDSENCEHSALWLLSS